VSTNVPEHEPLFPPASSRRSPASTNGRSTRRAPCGHVGAPACSGPIAAARSPSASSGWSRLKIPVLRPWRSFSFVTTAPDDGPSPSVPTRWLWGWPFAGALRSAALRARARPCTVACGKEGIPAGHARVHPVPRRCDRHEGGCRADAYVEAKVGLAGPPSSARSARPSCSGSGSTPNSDPAGAPAGHTGFLLNLFNLLPIVPLDGGARDGRHPPCALGSRASPALAALLIVAPNALLILILFFAARRGLVPLPRSPPAEAAAASYYSVPGVPAALLIAVVYVGVARRSACSAMRAAGLRQHVAGPQARRALTGRSNAAWPKSGGRRLVSTRPILP